MSASPEFKQDMPPPGGYKPISYKRVPAKTFFTGFALIGGYLGITAGGIYLYWLNRKSVHIRELEMRSASHAIYPMLLAERDREFLKQLRRNRDEEAKLMANVEGWKVGTWYGEPLYQTVDKDTLVDLTAVEFYVHASYKDFAKRINLSSLS